MQARPLAKRSQDMEWVLRAQSLHLEHSGSQKGIEGSINAKTVTYDLERQMEGATLLKCSEFGQAIVTNM